MKQLLMGLVIEGNSTSSTLLRLHGISAELGPIKSSSLQVARRVSNFLDGGYAVHSYADLASSRTILIRVPDAAIERVVAEISRSELEWQDHSFVLCETWAPTQLLAPLKNLGASIASLVTVPMGAERTFVVEGDMAAARQIKRAVERAGACALELRFDAKHLLFAASVLCTAVPVPALMMAQQALRDGGISGSQLSSVIDGMSGEMLSGFLKGSRTTWGGPMAELSETNQQVYWDQLGKTHPEVSDTLRQLVEWSRKYMQKKMMS